MMLPLIDETLSYALKVHLLEQVRRDVIGAADLESGELGATQEVAVCFADLVEFTRLGEEIDAEELGIVAGRLEEMAIEVAEPPVRLVKLIGDAAMLVAPDAEAVLEAALTLVDATEAEGERFPRLRAGIAFGPVLAQAGDYYGRPVNLASRITGIARPGSVLVDEGTKEGAANGFRYSFAGPRRLKGVDGRVRLYRARFAEPADQ
jgi:adenylate cyclase